MSEPGTKAPPSLSTVVMAFTVFVILFSVAYQWGYFAFFDLTFLSILTLEDYIQDSLRILPVAFISLYLGVMFLSYDPPKQTTAPLKSTLYRYQSYFYFVIMITLMLGFSTLLASLVFFMFITSILRNNSKLFSDYHKLPPESSILTFVLPTQLILAAVFGFGNATTMLWSSAKGQYTLTYTDGITQYVKFIRSTSKGMILRIPETGETFFVPAAQLAKFQTTIRRRPASLLCQFFDLCINPNERD